MAMKTCTEEDLGTEAGRQVMAGCLAAGGVAVFPTETFYGLGGDPRKAEVMARIALLKQRQVAKSFPLVAAGLEDAQDRVDLTAAGEEGLWRLLAGACWPGPLTLVARARPGLAAGAVAGDGTLAVRIPGHAGARTLASLCGGLLVATSANRSGRPPAMSAGEAVAGLAGAIDLLVDGGPVPGGQPSTLVSITSGRPRLLRDGAIPRTELELILGDCPLD